jgi:hypothetical protein
MGHDTERTNRMNRATLTIAGSRREFFATGDGYIFESVANGSCPLIGKWPRHAATCADAVRAILPKDHECAQCKRGQNKGSVAHGFWKGFVQGTDRRGNFRRTPYRAWLCDDHVDQLISNDGAELELVKLAESSH